MDNLSKERNVNSLGDEVEQQASFNSIYMMADSGARVLRPDPSAGRYAWPDGEAGWLHHRNADRGELP